MSVTNHGDIVALRQQLFASITRLADGASNSKEIERAKAIADTAQVIINSAKVEVDFIKAAGGKGGSGFIPLARADNGPQVIEQRPGVRVTRHRLADD